MVKASEISADPFPELSQLKVVVVDDMEFGRELARNLLMAAGIRDVAMGSNVREGWHLVCENRPNFLIIDWQMEGAPGIKLLEMVRQSPESPNPFLPILMLTAYREQHRVLEALGAGTTSYLVKPFTARDFFMKLKFCIEDRRNFVRDADYFGPQRAQSAQSLHIIDS